ncbi:MAG: aminomethyl-transferring glycine dehydrogenase subunit GcvPB [Oscillospiraceae bacterium]|jgi:glycine dehydrogenase subunit 2|nr:aminomethyl-transferring glycine dehydrogenase subunit GcvPB [Oscillospiraceae bacterium]
MSRHYDKLIFELSSEGKTGYRLPASGIEDEGPYGIPEKLLRTEAPLLPQVSEPEAVRHYTRLSRENYGLDGGMYPLGSCTMKYNPKFNEDAAAMPAFSGLHPYLPEAAAQGALRIMYELDRMLSEITGMAKFSLQPAAGAQGELAGLMIFKAWHESRGEGRRRRIIVPDSSHGTNPASAAEAGFEVVQIASAKDGTVDKAALGAALNEDVAGLMLTNPNTLGLFERDILRIAEMVHGAGGLLYYDGANMNAIMGVARPGDMGFDVIHLNMHKTFSTPHGGGGPGAGPLGVREDLIRFLPRPTVAKRGDVYGLDFGGAESIGRLKSFYGNFGVLLKAWCYIKMLGAEGLKEASQNAVLNANYIKESLKGLYKLPYDRPCMHEFVFDGLASGAPGVKTLDVAKRLIDLGFHPPTVYFPLIVENALMIEPTETESLADLDAFIAAMERIAREATAAPELLKEAPQSAPVRRVDELRAAKSPVLKWTEDEE